MPLCQRCFPDEGFSPRGSAVSDVCRTRPHQSVDPGNEPLHATPLRLTSPLRPLTRRAARLSATSCAPADRRLQEHVGHCTHDVSERQAPVSESPRTRPRPQARRLVVTGTRCHVPCAIVAPPVTVTIQPECASRAGGVEPDLTPAASRPTDSLTRSDRSSSWSAGARLRDAYADRPGSRAWSVRPPRPSGEPVEAPTPACGRTWNRVRRRQACG